MFEFDFMILVEVQKAISLCSKGKNNYDKCYCFVTVCFFHCNIFLLRKIQCEKQIMAERVFVLNNYCHGICRRNAYNVGICSKVKENGVLSLKF